MEYRRCNRCVMDTIADPNITFDAEGNCNYCTNALSQINTTTYFPGEEGQHRLQAALERIKADGRGKPYDWHHGHFRRAGFLLSRLSWP